MSTQRKLIDEELEDMNFKELFDSYRMPSGEATEKVEKELGRAETRIIKTGDKVASVTIGLLLVPIAVPLFTCAGFLMGIAAIIEILKDVWETITKKST